jgi:hypothetical protein
MCNNAEISDVFHEFFIVAKFTTFLGNLSDLQFNSN